MVVRCKKKKRYTIEAKLQQSSKKNNTEIALHPATPNQKFRKLLILQTFYVLQVCVFLCEKYMFFSLSL